jgi:hypothetical protein
MAPQPYRLVGRWIERVAARRKDRLVDAGICPVPGDFVLSHAPMLTQPSVTAALRARPRDALSRVDKKSAPVRAPAGHGGPGRDLLRSAHHALGVAALTTDDVDLAARELAAAAEEAASIDAGADG